ncbi:MAG: Na+:solute symporter [Candidatus Marinimicrobia bacterium]|jgi:solute:Na+ symporter, SSS family|nr:Na+:solute symporter [Candidatus Neomarinimicrobiota bacterium]MBT4361612.1 Na+:solute symporter [Candidatus Neomarinimicrobiota bacterium]MBT4714024.1 Na+:solute symporter [Candidatus Neomarinimicrobiota bacterium]MBT4947020.1 Na+:solute symporter [Candidatus Neomarinimicrobiota bacterium]MBT5268482.1 Na+:solute symporter [Candidatus Neomarinimicrobiota bacterium]
MTLHIVDSSIIVIYLVAVVLMGLWLRSRAGEGMDAYFLGGRSIPWYVLGVSNASSMFDIAGTMWLVSMLFVYGLKGTWLPWLWPTFNQIFLMIYLAVWIRRSGVVTGAEWIGTRFGKGRGAELSRIAIVVFALISVVSFLIYAYQGVGRFAAAFLPWDWTPDTYAMVLMGITTFYVILGGMFSVVITDVFQFIMLTIASIFIAVIAMTNVAPDALNAVIPDGWKTLFFGYTLDLDWSGLIPSVTEKIKTDGYNMFTIVWMMMLFKGILTSMAGTAPNYDMQRVLATRSPKESAMMSGMVSAALVPRWLMIGGIAVLGLVFFSGELRSMQGGADFEMLMPFVIREFFPVGVTGLVIAGLLAAYMSTFDSTVNSGAAYLVNDIYKRYIDPDATEKKVIWMSYGASILIVVVGIIMGTQAESIHSAMGWIVTGLWGGFTAPNVLKWHWWRFNGYGYFWGMLSGIVTAMVLAQIVPSSDYLYYFPVTMGLGAVGSVLGSLLTAPDEMDDLKAFYTSVRPWGFWGPVAEAVHVDDPDFKTGASAVRDLSNVAVGIIWQTSLVVAPVYLIIREWYAMGIAVALAVATSYWLKKRWFDELAND